MTKWNWRNLEIRVKRSVGLDPDGELVPMQPHKTDMQQFNEMLAEGEKHVRDSYLCRALRFM